MPLPNADPLNVVCLTENEVELIAQIAFGEAGNQSEYGQRLVIDTILNRIDDEHFPNTVNEVIFANNQFATSKCVGSYPVKDDICQLVREECVMRTNYKAVYFNCGGYNSYGIPLFQEGAHYFSACKYGR